MSVDGGFTVRCIPALPPTQQLSVDSRIDPASGSEAAPPGSVASQSSPSIIRTYGTILSRSSTAEAICARRRMPMKGRRAVSASTACDLARGSASSFVMTLLSAECRASCFKKACGAAIDPGTRSTARSQADVVDGLGEERTFASSSPAIGSACRRRIAKLDVSSCCVDRHLATVSALRYAPRAPEGSNLRLPASGADVLSTGPWKPGAPGWIRTTDGP